MAMKNSIMAINGEMIKQDNKVADEYLKKAVDLKLLLKRSSLKKN